MADEWRVEVELDDEGHGLRARRAAALPRPRRRGARAARRRGDRHPRRPADVPLRRHGGGAREAERVARELMAADGLEAPRRPHPLAPGRGGVEGRRHPEPAGAAEEAAEEARHEARGGEAPSSTTGRSASTCRRSATPTTWSRASGPRASHVKRRWRHLVVGAPRRSGPETSPSGSGSGRPAGTELHVEPAAGASPTRPSSWSAPTRRASRATWASERLRGSAGARRAPGARRVAASLWAVDARMAPLQRGLAIACRRRSSARRACRRCRSARPRRAR